MTVQELIDELKKIEDKDAKVYITDHDNFSRCTISEIEVQKKEQIDCRFNYYKEWTEIELKY